LLSLTSKYTEADFKERTIKEIKNKFWERQQRVTLRYFVIFIVFSVIFASALVFVIATNRGWYVDWISNSLMILFILAYIFYILMIIVLILSPLLFIAFSIFCLMSKLVDIKKVIKIKQQGDYFQLIQMVKDKKAKPRYSSSTAPYYFIYNHYKFICAALSDFNEKNVEEALYTLTLEDGVIVSYAKKALREIGQRKGFETAEEFIDYIAQRRNYYLGK